MRKLTFLFGFGAGYVLGTRAGRERYDQIVDKVRGFAGMPVVQDTAQKLQEEAIDLVDTAKDAVKSKLHSADPPAARAHAGATFNGSITTPTI